MNQMAKSRNFDIISMTEFGDDEDPLQALRVIQVVYGHPRYHEYQVIYL